MHQKTTTLQKRYQGFLKTECLFTKGTLCSLKPFAITHNYTQINAFIPTNLRLGKYIERFVAHQLNNTPNISILAENCQIQDNKRTVGELDFIITKQNTPIHLEVVYKFYLYNARIGNTEIEHFIGPNKKDSLVEKLTKLKDKQLPLLYTKPCKVFLDTLPVVAKNCLQQVYFKAQLFVPLSDKKLTLVTLNNKCIVGFYINLKDLEQFNTCKFYIPIKKDWLLIPHTHVPWLSYNTFKTEVTPALNRQFSPLCWLKQPNGQLKKFFLVWW